ncbi:MAG: hypothetical protein J7577_13485 [Sphingobacteriaceae bacterium]|nr:hypothetical protein [Sphingobacteriaceae bacterium]
MFTEQQLTELRESLPYDGNKRIKAKLHRTSAKAIADALKDASTKRVDILNAAVLVAKEFKGEVLSIANEIKELAS